MRVLREIRGTSPKAVRLIPIAPPPPDNQVCPQCGAATVVDGVNQGHAFFHTKGKWDSTRGIKARLKLEPRPPPPHFILRGASP